MEKEIKNHIQFYDESGKNIKAWYETVNKETCYWKKINGISWEITKRQYSNLVKKTEKANLKVPYNVYDK